MDRRSIKVGDVITTKEEDLFFYFASSIEDDLWGYWIWFIPEDECIEIVDNLRISKHYSNEYRIFDPDTFASKPEDLDAYKMIDFIFSKIIKIRHS